MRICLLNVIKLPSLILLILICISQISIAGTSGIKEICATTTWTGFYMGINGGYSWTNARTDILPLPEPTPPGDGNIQPTSLLFSISGGVLGGQIGYNWQLRAYPQVYLGLETDMNWNSLKDSTTGDAVGNAIEHFTIFNDIISTTHKTTWFGTLRGRLGFSTSTSLLLFGTGGLAYGAMEEVANVDFTINGYGNEQYPVTKSRTQTGWVAGGGIEWAPKQNWSVKLEYLYYDLGTISEIVDPIIPNPPFQIKYTWINPVQLIRLGLNYQFLCS